jgi:hypothetical protein
MLEDGTDPLDYPCPRCGDATTARFFGPCPACVDALHQAFPGSARAVEAEEYAPKMNVTPNAVALKE